MNVEREVFDADVARRLEDPVRQPLHLAARVHHHVRVDYGRVVTCVGTTMDKNIHLVARFEFLQFVVKFYYCDNQIIKNLREQACC